MTSTYSIRLVCLCLACFFWAYLGLGLATLAIAPAGVRVAGRMRPSQATRFLLALRTLPFALALLVVWGLCLPSYLWLEPVGTAERISLACVIAALAGVSALVISIARALSASVASLGCLRCYDRQELELAGREGHVPVWVIDGRAPLIALAGIFRPRIIVSRGIVRGLSPEQLDAALRHERAHWASRDNLKRLLLLLVPDPFPLFGSLHALDRTWAKFTEWAADDRAVDGDAARSLSLASALVRVARMGAPAQLLPLVASLAGGSDDLSVRIDRLLRTGRPATEPRRRVWMIAGGAAAVGLALLCVAMMQPTTLYSVHRLLEHLVR